MANTPSDPPTDPTKVGSDSTKADSLGYSVDAAGGSSGSFDVTQDLNSGEQGSLEVTQDSGTPSNAPSAATHSDQTRPTEAKQPAANQGSGQPQKISVLGDFRLIRKLGQGGMGAVYKAHQISLDRPVALKVMAKHLADNARFIDRFRREARIQANLDHPNIVRGYWVGEEKGFHLFAMEYVDGPTVHACLKKLGKFSVGDALHIALAVAHAMQYAHEQGMIHRDIKPDNLLINSKGAVKVADLGLAKALDEELSLTQSGTGVGTPFYMSPEQTRNAKHVDHRTDIYAIGCMLYVFLTGRMPFEGTTTIELLQAKESGKFVPVRKHNPEVPEKLDLMIEKSLAKNPDHRYQSCAELIRDLESLGLANRTLSFIAKASATLPTSATADQPTVPQMTQPAAKKTAAKKTQQFDPNVWFIRYRDEDGDYVHRKLTTAKLHQLIRTDQVDRTTEASHHPREGFRPLATYREFEAEMRARATKAKADRRATKIQQFYENLEEEERRYQRMKFFRRLFQSVSGIIAFILFLLALAAIVFLIYWFFDPIMELIGIKLGGAGGPPAVE